MTLERLSLQPYARTAMHFLPTGGEEKFDFDMPYQRGHVWELADKQALIKSMLLGLPIGQVVTNFRGSYASAPYFRVIDGKQRIHTIREFGADMFPIPGEWVGDDLPELVTMGELGETFRRTFAMCQFPEIQASVKTVAEEAEIFRLINATGVPQTDADLARAAAVA